MGTGSTRSSLLNIRRSGYEARLGERLERIARTRQHQNWTQSSMMDSCHWYVQQKIIVIYTLIVHCDKHILYCMFLCVSHYWFYIHCFSFISSCIHIHRAQHKLSNGHKSFQNCGVYPQAHQWIIKMKWAWAAAVVVVQAYQAHLLLGLRRKWKKNCLHRLVAA